MEEKYTTVVIKIIGETAPFHYEISLKDAVPTALVTDIRTGIYSIIDEVIACFEVELPEWLEESIRESLKNGQNVEFNLKEAYSVPE